MKPKVFISSTYIDLMPHRKKLWEVLSDMDVDILGMEKFGARTSSPIDTCLQEVTQSDIYIGILAYRYCSIHKIYNKSFTQLEYERAIDLKKEILIYFFDNDGLIKPKYVDIGENGLKLNSFKIQLQENHTIDSFIEPEDLVLKVSEKLAKLLPNLVKKKFVRPLVLESKLFRFLIDNRNWIVFIGYLDNYPFELYTVEDNNPSFFSIPPTIKSGKIEIMKNSDGNEYLAFTYFDKYGYKNSIGGVNHTFNKQMSQYNLIIASLLQKYTPMTTIFDAIDNMEISGIQNSDDWKNGVKNALLMK